MAALIDVNWGELDVCSKGTRIYPWYQQLLATFGAWIEQRHAVRNQGTGTPSMSTSMMSSDWIEPHRGPLDDYCKIQ